MKRIIDLSLIFLFSITLTSCAEGARLASESNSIETTNTVVPSAQAATSSIPETTIEMTTEPVTEGTIEHITEPETTSTTAEELPKKSTVPLSETKTFSEQPNITIEDLASDPWDNPHNNVYVFWGEYYTLNTGGSGFDQPYIEKYLGGEYKNFSATIIPHKEFDEYNKGVEAVIKVYADDKLAYTSDNITRKTKSKEINLSVEGTDYLKIELCAATDLRSFTNKYNVIVENAVLSRN